MSTFRWHHTQLWLYGHWLPGDPRGFRSRNHRIHSSGDYKHRPPQGEHANLHARAAASLKHKPITLTQQQRTLVGQLIVCWCDIKDTPLAVASVGGAHCHLLVELPRFDEDATIGKLKRYVSTESTRRDPSIPSKLFAAKGEPKPVTTDDYFRTAHQYILDHAAQGAWVWSSQEPGQGRGRP